AAGPPVLFVLYRLRAPVGTGRPCARNPIRIAPSDRPIAIAMNSNSTSTSYPRISIIVPSFNAEATIGRAVDSLIQQQYPDLEIICIDGASRDATVEVLRGYGPAISYLLSEPDRNSAEAINKGLRRATGELVGWL